MVGEGRGGGDLSPLDPEYFESSKDSGGTVRGHFLLSPLLLPPFLPLSLSFLLPAIRFSGEERVRKDVEAKTSEEARSGWLVYLKK